MRILILGGTRFIGPHVVRLLVERGHGVAVFHRGHQEPELPHGVLRLHGDRHRLADHAAEFRTFAPDVVLDMIAMNESDARADLEVFTGLAGRLVVASSMDVYRAYGILLGLEPGPPQPVPLTEEAEVRTRLYPYRGEKLRPEGDPARHLDEYDKILVERLVFSEPRLPATVLRLPMVYGPGDGQHRLFDPVKRMRDARPAILLEQRFAAWRTTRGYVENVAAAIALAVGDKRAAGRLYNVGEQQSLTQKQWVEAIGREAGWRGAVYTLPAEELPPAYAPGFQTSQDLVADSTRIRRELGYVEPIARPDALRRSIEWQRRNRPASYDPAAFDYPTEDKILARFHPSSDEAAEESGPGE